MPLGQSVPSRRTLLATAALLPLAGRPAEAAAATAPKRAQHYYDRAAALAGADPVLKALVKALAPGLTMPEPTPLRPLRTFDDVAVLGNSFIQATALFTAEGIVLVDAMGSPDEAEKIIVPGLRAVGADPAQIKYVVVAHGHADHFGGAQFLADRYGARVMMSRTDWNLIAAERPANAPKRDLEIADGQELTLGGTTIAFHHTPGHTPGTVSPIFPVHWKGRRHTAMLWGGTNPPAATADKRTSLASVLAFAATMRRAGVEVELNNHGGVDHGLALIEQLRAGTTGAANPFVIGRARAQRFMKVMEVMLRGRIAQDQETAAG
ncbi:MBL fold metallo-hydrolase [Nonomuraea sp. WAC 01424]|uniref:MBL fold metallo-hydrolase n=1 Tax=Nonomuraea sp. WAC 01424 TaxID=2203200 RepID=UPI000F77456D|nr:MBL fold metallo-hydrolase [Nonomuraea sp. WAC 01424]RSM98186.1 MBL fold metallo-hydrolase [Nonomuraea sp. WAC 01424]